MARRRNDTQTLVELDPETGEPLDMGPPPGPQGGDTDATRKSADLYFQMLGEGEEGSGYMTVHWLGNGAGQSEISVARFPSDKHTLDDMIEIVRRDSASVNHPGKPSDYRFRLYMKTKTGRHVMVGNKLVEIMGVKSATAGATAPALLGTADPAMVALVRDLMARQEAMQKEMVESLKQLREPPKNSFLDTLVVLGPIVTPLIAAWLTRPKEDSMKALTTALTLTGTIKEMRDANDGLPAPGEEKPWYADMLARTVNNLPQVLQALNQRTANVAAMPPPVPGAVPSPDAPPQPQPGQPGHPFWQQIDVLVRVQTQADPAEVAAQLWTGMPPSNRDALVGFLDRDGWYADLAAIHPGVLGEPGWWADLAADLLERAGTVQTAEIFPVPETVNDGQSNHVAAHS